MSAPGATPGPTFQVWELMVVALYGPWNVLPSLSTPKPAAVPAVCDPWPLQSRGFVSGIGFEPAMLAL